MKTRLLGGVSLGLAVAMIATFAIASGKIKKTNVHGIGWYNSFEDAKAEAKRTGKPILFLSMFGKLDEEMPCANARTLRATLFKDPEFKKLVTDDVIPAWEMVRAVPKVEIDFGDGKKIKRTVRGNACMYLCNSDGKVVDAYPGVYTKEDFMPMVREAISMLGKADAATILAWHEERANAAPLLVRSTMSKSGTESPTLNLVGVRGIAGFKSTETSTDPKRQKFLRAAAMVIDMSLSPMTPDEVALQATGQPIADKNPSAVGNLIIQRDSQQNVGVMRGIIHLWLASEKELPTPLQARDTILETILKIPYKDPYFGLKDIAIPGTPD